VILIILGVPLSPPHQQNQTGWFVLLRPVNSCGGGPGGLPLAGPRAHPPFYWELKGRPLPFLSCDFTLAPKKNVLADAPQSFAPCCPQKVGIPPLFFSTKRHLSSVVRTQCWESTRVVCNCLWFFFPGCPTP